MMELINSVSRFVVMTDAKPTDVFDWAKAYCPAVAGKGPYKIEVAELPEDPDVWRVTFHYGEDQVFEPTVLSALVGA